MITQEVTILKIDQIAKRPIPITVNTGKNTIALPLNSMPKTNDSIINVIIINVTVMRLKIELIRASLIPLFFSILFTSL